MISKKTVSEGLLDWLPSYVQYVYKIISYNRTIFLLTVTFLLLAIIRMNAMYSKVVHVLLNKCLMTEAMLKDSLGRVIQCAM